MDTIYNCSASQLKTGALCLRKWAYSKVVPRSARPDTAAQKLGKDVHTELELWIRDHRVPDTETRAGQIAIHGLSHIPAPGEGIAEGTFKYPIDNVNYRGAIDVSQRLSERVMWIVDHKTTARWNSRMTPEQMLGDEQVLVYSEIKFRQYPELTHVVCQWQYYATVGDPKSEPVVVTLTREQCAKLFSRIHERACAMGNLLPHVRQLDWFPRTLESCFEPYRCEYREHCHRDLPPQESANLYLDEIVRLPIAKDQRK